MFYMRVYLNILFCMNPIFRYAFYQVCAIISCKYTQQITVLCLGHKVLKTEDEYINMFNSKIKPLTSSSKSYVWCSLYWWTGYKKLQNLDICMNREIIEKALDIVMALPFYVLHECKSGILL